MLERVTILPQQLDLGAIAEAVVYYGKVEIRCFNGHIADLVERVGIDTAIRVAESDLIDFRYSVASLSIMTDNDQLYPHDIFTILPDQTADGRKIRSAADELDYTFANRFGNGVINSRDVRRLVGAFLEPVNLQQRASEHAISDFEKHSFFTNAVKLVLENQFPSYPNLTDVNARIVFSPPTPPRRWGQFMLASNVDFALTSKLLAKTIGEPQSQFGPGNLIAPIVHMHEALLYAGGNRCDIWADNTCSALLQLRVNSLLDRLENGKKNIDRFHELKFSRRSFAEAVNNNARSLADVMDFVEKDDTRKFKRWIAASAEQADLLVEYEKSKLAPSALAASLPFKAGKLVLFATVGAALDRITGGSGVAGVIGGLAGDALLNSADEFITSRLRLGWRPNQWVAMADKFLN